MPKYYFNITIEIWMKFVNEKQRQSLKVFLKQIKRLPQNYPLWKTKAHQFASKEVHLSFLNIFLRTDSVVHVTGDAFAGTDSGIGKS